MKIVVLAGGLSPERDVSLSSGSLIANALRDVGHKVVLVDVYEGISQVDTGLECLFKDKSGGKYEYVVPETEPDLEEIKQRNNNGDALIGSNVIEICRLADVTFIGLHGAMGENGQIQATFDVLGIKYTGTGYLGSLLAMDKDISKKLMKEAQVKTPKWLTVSPDEVDTNEIVKGIGLPSVVKPCSSGSSIGVSIVEERSQLQAALESAEKIEAKLLIEQMVEGREFSVGIIDNVPLPVIEIKPKSGFYDYTNKYQANFTEEICPADLSQEDEKMIQGIALKVHYILELGSYSRVDFILDKVGEFYCLEANTLPGMTPTSLLPQEALAVGISYNELCNKIVELSENTNN